MPARSCWSLIQQSDEVSHLSMPMWKDYTKNTIFAAFIRQQDENFEQNSDIKRNFTKFLINRKGNVVARFEPIEDMSKVEKRIAENI